MQRLRLNSQRLFQLAWLLTGLAMPSGIAVAAAVPEARTALFAAG